MAIYSSCGCTLALLIYATSFLQPATPVYVHPWPQLCHVCHQRGPIIMPSTLPTSIMPSRHYSLPALASYADHVLHDGAVSQVVVDEAHHSVAPTYKVLLQGLGLIEEVPAPPPADPQQPDSSDSSAAALSSLHSLSEVQQRSSMDSLDEGEEQLDAASAASASSSWGEDSESSEASAADEEGSSSTAASGPKMMIRVKPNPHQLLLGFTATPYRMKKAESEDLYSIFPSYSYARTIQDMIRDNHLTQVRLVEACTWHVW
jgi:hypothetical protein